MDLEDCFETHLDSSTEAVGVDRRLRWNNLQWKGKQNVKETRTVEEDSSLKEIERWVTVESRSGSLCSKSRSCTEGNVNRTRRTFVTPGGATPPSGTP